jgi:predicted nucleic acid-binding Zn ribbon protein
MTKRGIMPEKQAVFRICENRIIKRQSLERPGFFIRNSDRFEAWYYLKNFLQQIKPLSKSTYFLPIYDRFSMPVSPYQDTLYSKDEIKEMINQDKVCEEACSLSSMQTAAQQRKARFGDFMGITVMGIVVLLIIVVLLAASGKFNLGAIMGG